MVTLLQAALGVSDREAMRCAAADSHWQILPGTRGSREPGFSQGTLFHFRQRLMASQMERRLLERTLELAKRSKLFGAGALRTAFDASPLWGAARVEDTFNLLGHAMRYLLQAAAQSSGMSVEQVRWRAGLVPMAGKSVKADLDIDWAAY